MGYTLNHAIVITSWNRELLGEAWLKAMEIFGSTSPSRLDPHDDFTKLVSPIMPVVVNGGRSFFIGPDGSKEGWDTSDDADAMRAAFLDWCEEQRYEDGSSSLKWCELILGGDDRIYKVTRSEGDTVFEDEPEEEMHNYDCGPVGGGWPHPASAHDD